MDVFFAKEAQKWEEWLKQQLSDQGEWGTRIWRLSPIGDELDQFRAATRGHLLIAGRFEGMDFPDDVCRLAVFPSQTFTTCSQEFALFSSSRL